MFREEPGCELASDAGPPRHFFLSFLRFSIVTNYCTYILYLLTITKATTNIVKRCDDVPQKPRFSPNAGFAIRPSPPILMRWPWPESVLDPVWIGSDQRRFPSSSFKASMGFGERPNQRRVSVPTVNPWTRIENTTTT